MSPTKLLYHNFSIRVWQSDVFVIFFWAKHQRHLVFVVLIPTHYICPSYFARLLIREFLNSRVNFSNFCWNGLLLLFIRLIREPLQLEPINRKLGGTTVSCSCGSETSKHTVIWSFVPKYPPPMHSA